MDDRYDLKAMLQEIREDEAAEAGTSRRLSQAEIQARLLARQVSQGDAGRATD